MRKKKTPQEIRQPAEKEMPWLTGLRKRSHLCRCQGATVKTSPTSLAVESASLGELPVLPQGVWWSRAPGFFVFLPLVPSTLEGGLTGEFRKEAELSMGAIEPSFRGRRQRGCTPCSNSLTKGFPGQALCLQETPVVDKCPCQASYLMQKYH